jgi:hypothetical protein
MTEQQTPADLALHPALAAVAEPTPVVLTAPPGSRLEQLHASYADAKAAADEASARVKAITDAIKLELTAAAPEERRIELAGDTGPTLRLTYTERWTLDTKRMKAEDPHTYVRYAKKGGAWSLRAAGGQ